VRLGVRFVFAAGVRALPFVDRGRRPVTLARARAGAPLARLREIPSWDCGAMRLTLGFNAAAPGVILGKLCGTFSEDGAGRRAVGWQRKDADGHPSGAVLMTVSDAARAMHLSGDALQPGMSIPGNVNSADKAVVAVVVDGPEGGFWRTRTRRSRPRAARRCPAQLPEPPALARPPRHGRRRRSVAVLSPGLRCDRVGPSPRDAVATRRVFLFCVLGSRSSRRLGVELPEVPAGAWEAEPLVCLRGAVRIKRELLPEPDTLPYYVACLNTVLYVDLKDAAVRELADFYPLPSKWGFQCYANAILPEGFDDHDPEAPD
jgi:hypothetical protein